MVPAARLVCPHVYRHAVADRDAFACIQPQHESRSEIRRYEIVRRATLAAATGVVTGRARLAAHAANARATEATEATAPRHASAAPAGASAAGAASAAGRAAATALRTRAAALASMVGAALTARAA